MSARHAFWRGRRVLVTGHTGFKGAWLALALGRLGARVSGIALAPEPGPSLFAALAPWPGLDHRELDLRAGDRLAAALRELRPEVVFHLAAQAIVGRGFREPLETFAVNLTGTLNLLQSLRGCDGVRAAVLVTSDKVYRNDGSGRRFVESDPLGGADPYSASKAAAELAVASWRHSFGAELPALATARAGNVIGGGDFGEARLIPDLVRAQVAGRPLAVRYPEATRPWQHVLEVSRGYLDLAQSLVERPDSTPLALNFGPAEGEGPSVQEMIARFGLASGEPVPWCQAPGPLPPEAPRLGLDPGLAERCLGWHLGLDGDEALRETAAWYAAWRRGEDLRSLCLAAIESALGRD
jgi:CDP-glucose 4,6-dehydratase